VAQRAVLDVLLRNQTPNPLGLIGEECLMLILI
jgi:hypothetical protein